MKHLWEVEHSYYCNQGNYTFNNAGSYYDSFDEFLESWGEMDLDYNLLFRWDWKDSQNPGYELSKGDELQLSWMLQRKGHYVFSVVKVKKEDELKVIEFLKPRLEYMKQLWEPMWDIQKEGKK